MRPSAKYLQQHKFAAMARPGAQAALVPLIARSKELIVQAAAAEQAAQAAQNGRCGLLVPHAQGTARLLRSAALFTSSQSQQRPLC